MSRAPYDTLNLGDHVGDEIEHVEENRRLVALAIDAQRLVIVRQVHGDHVLDASRARSSSEADALFDDDSDLALAILVADCIPLVMVDAASRRFCLVHAGWRGLSAGVIPRALERFSDPHSVHVFLGPSISAESYQVGPDVANNFVDVHGAVIPDGGDRSRLDLRRVAVAQLVHGGVVAQHVTCSEQVTDGGDRSSLAIAHSDPAADSVLSRNESRSMRRHG